MKHYVSLTSAVASGKNIDWEQLDGKTACIEYENPYGSMRAYFTLKKHTGLDGYGNLSSPSSWTCVGLGTLANREALIKAWNGEEGYNLSIAGGIPTKGSKFLSELEVGDWMRFNDGEIGVIGVDDETDEKYLILMSGAPSVIKEEDFLDMALVEPLGKDISGIWNNK